MAKAQKNQQNENQNNQTTNQPNNDNNTMEDNTMNTTTIINTTTDQNNQNNQNATLIEENDPLETASRASENDNAGSSNGGSSNLSIDWDSLQEKIDAAESSIQVQSLPKGDYLMCLKHVALRSKKAENPDEYDVLWLSLQLKVVADLNNKNKFASTDHKGNVLSKTIFLVNKTGMSEWGIAEFKTFIDHSGFTLNGKKTYNAKAMLDAQERAAVEKSLSIWDDIEGSHLFYRSEEYVSKNTQELVNTVKLTGVPTEEALKVILKASSHDSSSGSGGGGQAKEELPE